MRSYKKLTLPLLVLLNFTASLAMDAPDLSPQTAKRKRENNVESRSVEDRGTLKEQEETRRPSKKRRDSPEKQSESLEESTELRFGELPTEIQVHILKHLTKNELLKTRTVCSEFKNLISSFATVCPDYTGKGALIDNKNVERFTQLTEIIKNTDNQNSPEEIASAHFGLGELYLMGAFKAPNYQKALDSYNESIKLGYSYAYVRKGLMYEEGLGGLKDQITADFHYKKSNYETREEAFHQLAYFFLDQSDEHELLKDYLKAFELYKKLDAQGDSQAQYYVGLMYEEGFGVEKDAKIAVEWYRKSAEQGYPVAQWILGNKYEEGVGVPQDGSLAVHWYQKAANQGDVYAQRALGIMYQEGKGGVKQDYSLAIHWHLQAANQGDSQSQRALEIMYQLAAPYLGSAG